jgi:hypothetical protein
MNKKGDLTNLDEKELYEAFNVKGNEEQALTKDYFYLYELLGEEAMLKIFKQCRGDKINCPMKLYKADFIADLVMQTNDKRMRAEIARAGGYSLKFIEGILQKRKKNEND